MPGADDEIDALRAEIRDLRAELDRLRGLVGPSETSYEQLRADVHGAREAARAAEAAAGELRGRIAELETLLARADRGNELLLVIGDAGRSVRTRLRRLVPGR